MMNNSITLLLALLVGLVGFAFTNKKRALVREDFLPPMSFKVDRVAAPNQKFADCNMFWSVPKSPLLAATTSAATPTAQQQQQDGGVSALDPLLTADGDASQPIVYDRFIYANKKSRLRQHGDPIRGDLPIIPHNSDWFRPSVTPHLDLKEGALQAIGGFDNGTNNQLSALMNASAGNALQTFGGAAFSGPGGLASNLGLAGPQQPLVSQPPMTGSLPARYMSALPYGSNLMTGQTATGMIPQYTAQKLVHVDRAGDVQVLRS
ncbi:hypothetical protein MIV107R [Invertebrate iridescent virus 3]|uniref:Uncharacterized protein 107R n=1 Tax=Invertebrate iridescent virus 3 TaxID=345201 RepID=VF117_IIV3|nr:hypothetical protein MIV107R [Invertebrate iridescent virus 3]Q196V3.1 RecName: Full=Uncharacterized protein 107R; Flags: Precursor [Invertebrate iridescent virus 3]ABF82137.1 hypothetical protein MIV107R [Invertebrate iridescent virus 3]